MTLNSALQISASGLTAERFRLDVISSNIANADTTQIGNTPPYRRQEVELQSGPDGVQVAGIVPDMSAFPQKVDWTNPNHDPQTGVVTSSNVQPVVEMVDMLSASRAYEANIAAFNSAKSMIQDAFTIGKV